MYGRSNRGEPLLVFLLKSRPSVLEGWRSEVLGHVLLDVCCDLQEGCFGVDAVSIEEDVLAVVLAQTVG